MKKFILLLSLLLCAAYSYASEFNQVQTILSKPKILSGHFKQIQKIPLLKAPLISSGKFILAKNIGLKWHQTAPFKSTLIVTPDKIQQTIENNPPIIITQQQQPLVFSFTKLFLGVFNGDTKTITEYFKIYFRGNTAAWTITLKPLDAPLNRAISSTVMSGGKYIKSITINEAGHSQMIIYLSNVREQ